MERGSIYGGPVAPTGDADLGARLRALRQSQGVALKVVAKRAAVSVAYLSEVERGRKLPALDVLARIATALGTTVPSLLRGLRPYDD
jgi:transcriptional regulator with XRE-family HTH domain